MICPKCHGMGRIYHRWIDADLRERLSKNFCFYCKGSGQLPQVPLSGKDLAAGEREDEE
jgi:hypothetical protein